MRKPRLLDLFSGAGGASVGYARAGFEVVGVDIKPQKNYPFEFHQDDALETLRRMESLFRFKTWKGNYDAIHASPPCQMHSITANLARAQGKKASEINLIPETRALLIAIGLPYVIENVPGSPLRNDLTLCGSSFGLKVKRHRVFESNIPLMSLPCNHEAQGRPIGVYGSRNDDIPQGGRTARTLTEGQEAMGIDWMPWSKLVLAIPPDYTEYIGQQLLQFSSSSILSKAD